MLPPADRLLNRAAPPRRRSLRMTPDERRAHLIATTIGLVGSRPLADISPELIAREAGVSRALFYRYFSGLAEAYAEAFQTITGQLKDSLVGLSSGHLPDQLETGLEAYLDFALAFREAYVAMFTFGAASAGGPLSGHVEQVRQTVIEVIKDRSGVVPSPVFEMTVRCWMSATETAVLRWLELEPIDRDAIQNWLFDQLVAMLSVSAKSDSASEQVLEKLAVERR